jgi:hypothetical protein
MSYKKECTKEDNIRILKLLKKYQRELINISDGICAHAAPIGGMASVLYCNGIDSKIDEIRKELEELIITARVTVENERKK